MTALMDDIETFLEEDTEPGRPRTYSVATFDPVDGHLVRYVRRVMGTSERIEINVQLKKVGEPRAGPPNRDPLHSVDGKLLEPITCFQARLPERCRSG